MTAARVEKVYKDRVWTGNPDRVLLDAEDGMRRMT
jgi:hypothetical protein